MANAMGPEKNNLQAMSDSRAGPFASTRGGPADAGSAVIGSSAREQERLLSFLDGQTEVLALLSGREAADQVSIDRILSRIAALVERCLDPGLCAILVQGLQGAEPARLVAPNLPGKYLDTLNSRLNAQWASGAQIVQASYAADTREAKTGRPDWRAELAAAHGFLAYWSYPVADTRGRPATILALHFDHPREPTSGDKRILASLAELLRFAVEQHRRAMAARAADQNFLALAANVPGVVYQRAVSPDGDIRYTYISDGAKDLFGVSPEEILADPNALFDCHGAQYRETFRERLLAASRDLRLWDVEATIVTRTGERKYTHAIARPHREPDGTVMWNGIILDSTRIKEAELEAAITETRTREAILESISQGLVLYDKDDRLVVCNSHFRVLYPELRNEIEPGASYEHFARAVLAKGLAAPDGNPESDPEAQFKALMKLRRQGDFVVERRLLSGRWILINEHRTADGGTIILNTDVSELKKREAALEMSNQELENFASIASHDLQEPLRKIEAFGDRLRQKCGDSLGEDASMYLDRICSSAGRMRELINDLLGYSRVTSKGRSFELCDLKKIAQEVVGDLQVQIEETGAVVEIGNLPPLEADTTQMRQLLQNLIGNALKFHRKDEAPRVTVSASVHGGAPGGSNAVPGPGDVYELRVADNGIGFEMKYAERVFGIFQRLHGRSQYKGTGIGLATCRKIAERHGGKIVAQSEPGQGATFVVTVPAVHNIAEAA